MEKFYFAPLEGISGYVYRKAYEHYFGGIDKYFIPFIKPNQKGKLSSREKNDILPMHNQGMCAIPQILTNSAEDFIPIFIAPRLCRRKIAAVDPHIRRQQTAGVGDKGTVPGVVVPLWVNKETVLSPRVEDEQTVPAVIIVPDGIFVLRDEIIVSQQCAAELLEPLAWQLDDLIHGTGVCLTPGLLTLQFCLNDHRESPPISMPFLCRFSITSSMRKKPL